MIQQTETEIIRQGLQESLDKGKQIGKLLGRVDMLNEVRAAFPDKVPKSWLDERLNEVVSEVNRLLKEEAK